MPETGILCMAYGSPRTEGDVEAYYTHIRGGRRPSDESLEELGQRYRAIGGSPLEDITRRQAAALGELIGLPTFVGMKHAPPFISEGAKDAANAGIDRLIGLPLAPHYAQMSLGGYHRALKEAWNGELVLVAGFHSHPAFIASVRLLLEEAMNGWQPERLFFTAHSLPQRILREGDAYDERLLESCQLTVYGLSVPDWEFAYQSASHTGEPWLGPDLLEALRQSNPRSALVCPIGFVADHLEILYDLDIEAQAFARANGLDLRRTTSFNDRPEFIQALAAVVQDYL
jgi:ferrochelatase